MTQYLVPSGDVSAGTWNTAPLWSKVDDLNDTTPTDYINRANNSTGACRLGVLVPNGGGTANDPGVHTGHILTVDAAKVGSRTCTLTVSLYQGTTLITSGLAITLTTTYSKYTYTLSSTEAGNISDYTDLRIDINCTASGSSTQPRVSSAWLEIPGTQYYVLTVANLTQAQSVENVGLAPLYNLAVDNLTQAQVVGNVELVYNQPVANYVLTVQDITQAQSVGTPTLAEHFDLTVADASQAQSIGTPTLTEQFSLTAANIAQVQSVTNPTLSEQFALLVQGINQVQEVGGVTLDELFALVAGNISQEQSVDELELTYNQGLTPDTEFPPVPMPVPEPITSPDGGRGYGGRRKTLRDIREDSRRYWQKQDDEILMLFIAILKH